MTGAQFTIQGGLVRLALGVPGSQPEHGIQDRTDPQTVGGSDTFRGHAGRKPAYSFVQPGRDDIYSIGETAEEGCGSHLAIADLAKDMQIKRWIVYCAKKNFLCMRRKVRADRPVAPVIRYQTGIGRWRGRGRWR